VIFLYFEKELQAYLPINEQEEADKASILAMITAFPKTILFRENTIAHMTSSAFIVNKTLDKVLFIHHNIYNAWGWTGGHADGETDLLQVACREAREETGLQAIEPLCPAMASLDVLPVLPHRKNGRYVGAHLHFSPGYLLLADETAKLRTKADENSGVRWIPLAQIAAFCNEAHMLPVYAKLSARLRSLPPPIRRLL